MQIQLVPNADGSNEWMIVELHGVVAPKDGEFDTKTLGTICWSEKNTAFLIIGSQTLEGKIIKTDRPLLVIQKSDEIRLDGKKIAQINAIVRKKLIFKIRPRPLVISSTTIPTQKCL